jgi:hypothetical protein
MRRVQFLLTSIRHFLHTGRVGPCRDLGGAKETRVMPYEELSSITSLHGNSKCCVSGTVRQIIDFLLMLAFVGDMVVHAEPNNWTIRLKDD